MNILRKLWNSLLILFFLSIVIVLLIMFICEYPIVFGTFLGIIFIIGVLCYVKRHAIAKAINDTFEAGFRNNNPYDFLMPLDPAISLLEYNGYVEKEIDDAGGETPSVIMQNEEKGSILRITLIAPIGESYSFKLTDESDEKEFSGVISFDDVDDLVEYLKRTGMKECPKITRNEVQQASDPDDPFAQCCCN